MYFKYVSNIYFIFFLLYVHVMLIGAKSMKNKNDLNLLLNKEFDTKELCIVEKIFGIEIHKDRKMKKFWVSQKDIKKALERFGMDKGKPFFTLLADHFRLSNMQYP